MFVFIADGGIEINVTSHDVERLAYENAHTVRVRKERYTVQFDTFDIIAPLGTTRERLEELSVKF